MFSHKYSCIFSLLLLLIVEPCSAQNYRSASVEYQFGQVIAHDPTIAGVSASKPQSIQLRYSQTLSDSAFKSVYHITLQRGWLINYTNFKLDYLGQMTALAYYLQPTYTLSKQLQFGFSLNAGLAYATKPYDNVTNGQNISYGTHLNAFLSVATQLKFRLNNRFMLNATAQFNHISNGGQIKPNLGVNWYMAGAALEYMIPSTYKPYWVQKDTPRKHKLNFELTFSITNPKRDTVTSRNFLITGLTATVVRRGVLHGFSIGTEILNDPLYQTEAKRIGNATVNPWLVSGIIGHEFLLGRTVFSQQLGVYAHDIHQAYLAQWYHRWGLVYYPYKHIGLGVNFKLHQLTANFVDARVVYLIR
jgi:hypothetical protein